MIAALIFTFGLVGALVWRHGAGPGGPRLVAGVAALAVIVRLAAVTVINHYAYPIHDTGIWLPDEASFFLATEKLWPSPLDRPLQKGLDHLGGNGYLGVTVVFAWLGGVADSNAFRVVNVGLGSAVVVLSMLVARRVFGARAAAVSGLLLALWPTLILWSSTVIRDTFGAFGVVVVWWTLGRARELGWVRTVGATLLALAIVLSLRPYLGVGVALGVLAWAAYPTMRRAPKRYLATAAAAAIVLIGVEQASRIDTGAHELFYRQTVSRMEALGRLYTDQPEPTQPVPFRPGITVVLSDAQSGWALGGVVQMLEGADAARVAFTDGSIRDMPTAELQPLQQAPIPALQLATSLLPDLKSYVTGVATISSETSSLVWIPLALAWDALLVAAIVGAARTRLSAREWLYPLCIVAATTIALIAVPGAPGNADRHRASQTVAFLVVLASGLLMRSVHSERAADPSSDNLGAASAISRNQSSNISSAQR